MFNKVSLVLFATIAIALGQQIGTQLAETHPTLSVSTCAAGGTCTSQSRSVVLDGNWRWTHQVNTTTNCYTGNTWDTSICTSPTVCAQNCALDGADYAGTYGVTTSGNALTLKFVTQSSQKNVGSRLYLMQDANNYELFNLLGQEFTFDVDVSQLPCGLNGALYFVEMDQDGGKSRFPTNAAGAAYGTGYCDSQCPRDIKFIDGLANIVDWQPSSNNSNTGIGGTGTCCTEMDIWEANSMASAVTPHACSVNGQTSCTGNACGAAAGAAERYDGVCDPDGCDFNSFRMGDQSFYGPGLTIDTTQKFTVVTQFITSTGTSTGTLSEIRRFYVQNGVVHANSFSTFPTLTSYNSISDAFCNAQKAEFGDTNSFEAQGGMARMAAAFQKGMVLVMSLWDDYAVDMLWLDSDYPTTGNPATPGIARGNCSTTSGQPPIVEAQSPNAQVIYSNIRTGPINSTFTGGTASSSVGPTSTASRTSTAAAGTQTEFGQCGGEGWTGPTACVAPFVCEFFNDFYSQCLSA